MLSSWKNLRWRTLSPLISSVGYATRFLLWAKLSWNKVSLAVFQRETCKSEPTLLALYEAGRVPGRSRRVQGAPASYFRQEEEDLHPPLQSGSNSTFLCKPHLPNSLQWNGVNYSWIDSFSAWRIKMKWHEVCKGLVLWQLFVSQICFWAKWAWNVMAAAQ